jgi:hypothetical protein
MQAERDFTKMQLNDVRQQLLESQRHEKHPPRPQLRQEEQRLYRGHPYLRRTFSSRVQRMDFNQAANIGRANNLSMLPHNKFVIENLKKEISREEEHLTNN